MEVLLQGDHRGVVALDVAHRDLTGPALELPHREPAGLLDQQGLDVQVAVLGDLVGRDG
jgi:hypothetical protein